MRLHWLQHVPFEGLGVIEDWARERQWTTTCTRFHAEDPLPAAGEPDLLVVMGGPMNIYEHSEYPWLRSEKRFIAEAIDVCKPLLGICLGAQLIADVLGAKVTRNAHVEIGWHDVQLTDSDTESSLFDTFPTQFRAFHWHGDTFGTPNGAMRVAASEACENQAFVYGGRVVGLQFHLESNVDGVERLITHCGDELVEAPYVQNAEQIRSGCHNISIGNNLMRSLLEKMASLAV